MSKILIPEYLITDDSPIPLHVRLITIVEGLDPDGSNWINTLVSAGMSREEHDSLLRLAAAYYSQLDDDDHGLSS